MENTIVTPRNRIVFRKHNRKSKRGIVSTIINRNKYGVFFVLVTFNIGLQRIESFLSKSIFHVFNASSCMNKTMISMTLAWI